MASDRNNPTPYGSANDLPSVIEMRQLLAGGKLLTRVIARDQRQKLVDVERELDNLVALIDRFYVLLGPRHWLFTGNLPIPALEELLGSPASVVQVESGLIEIIRERIDSQFWRLGLMGHDAMRARSHTLERAREHYANGEWDSCTLQLVTVMDGFVNDVEPNARRGLHTREAAEMVAWDNIIGHHMGLTSVMPIFLRTFKRRHEDEVYEVHRHGIVHGTVIHYNNRVVATKAWNLVAAVCDWADAKRKAGVPEEPKPTLRSTVAGLADLARRRRYRETFEPSRVEASDPAFAENELVRESTRFLDSWAARRWAIVAEYLPVFMFDKDAKPGQRAAEAKAIYESSPLVEFSIEACVFVPMSLMPTAAPKLIVAPPLDPPRSIPNAPAPAIASIVLSSVA